MYVRQATSMPINLFHLLLALNCEHSDSGERRHAAMHPKFGVAAAMCDTQ